MREKLITLTRRMDEMEMKNQHNSCSVNELSASQPSCYNHQSHGHYGENCQENVQILNQDRPPLNIPFGNSYIQDWKNHSTSMQMIDHKVENLVSAINKPKIQWKNKGKVERMRCS